MRPVKISSGSVKTESGTAICAPAVTSVGNNRLLIAHRLKISNN
jgi:hypothetical protein